MNIAALVIMYVMSNGTLSTHIENNLTYAECYNKVQSYNVRDKAFHVDMFCMDVKYLNQYVIVK
jgi:hypothetical protein